MVVIGQQLEAFSAAALWIKAALAEFRAKDESSFKISTSIVSSPTCGEMSAGSAHPRKVFKECLRNLEVLE